MRLCDWWDQTYTINLHCGEGKWSTRLTHLRHHVCSLTGQHYQSSHIGIWLNLKQVGRNSKSDILAFKASLICAHWRVSTPYTNLQKRWVHEVHIISVCSLNKSSCGNIKFISNVSKKAVQRKQIWLNLWPKPKIEKNI